MSSLRTLSVSFIFIFTSLTSPGADRYRLSAGAAEAGAGYACITGRGFWASFQNQALLAGQNSFSAGINYDNRFSMSQLATRSAGAVIPAGRASLGVVYSTFGYSDFHRMFSGLACGLPLSDKLSAGIQIDYFAEKVPGDYLDLDLITGELGIVYRFGENSAVGLHVFNPVPNSVRKTVLPTAIRAGAGTSLNSLLNACAEAEMTSENDLLLRMGFEYEAVRNFRIRAGFCTENTSFSFGAGYQVKFAAVDLAFSSHDKLGITSSVSIIFKIKN